MGIDVAKTIASLKGLAGTGNVLSKIAERLPDLLKTLEPGDVAGKTRVSAVPLAYDLWYLWYNMNFLKKYHEDQEGADFRHYDYSAYLADNLSFIDYLPGLKPLKVYMDLEAQFTVNDLRFESVWSQKEQYDSNGIYFVNTIFFELMPKNKGIQYSSPASSGYQQNPNEYVGYIAFPVGQLGVMEVISLVQETDLQGYLFDAYSADSAYHQKPAISDLENEYRPTLQSSPEMFPDMKTATNQQLAGKNYCYGRHLVESAYLIPTMPSGQQNVTNSDGASAYAPVSDRDLELWADNIKDYGETIAPKKWMRYWIHKDNTWPVPGEFIGILVRPAACPPHLWWFQESAPFLYAGNWMETGNLTSGVVTEVTLESARTDGGTGDLYKVKVQGCEVQVTASDFYLYTVGDRVAIMKVESIAAPLLNSFTANDQIYLKSGDSFTNILAIDARYVIIPCTFFKKKT